MSEAEVEKNIDRVNSTNEEEIINRIINEDGCPLCAMVLDFEFDFLAKLQHEVAVDESTRKEIANEGGFCDFHFRQFKKIADGKTNILLLKTIIEEKIYESLLEERECRICTAVSKYEITGTFENKIWKIFWYLFAALTAAGRIYHDQHWLSDVIIAAFISVSVGIHINNMNRVGVKKNE